MTITENRNQAITGERRNEIQTLLQMKKAARIALQNPTTEHKSDIIDKLLKIDMELVKRNQLPYFCKKCHYKHRDGDIYQEHKKHAVIRFKFPKVTIPNVSANFTTKLVGLYSLKSGNIVEKIPPYSQVVLERLNRSNIAVSHKNSKIGYVYNKMSKFQAIVDALINGYEIKCFLVEYVPGKKRMYKKDIKTPSGKKSIKYMCWDAEYGVLEFEVFNSRLFFKVFRGLEELIELGHRNLESAFKQLGPRCLKHLKPKTPYHRKVIRFLQQFQRYSVQESEFGILL